MIKLLKWLYNICYSLSMRFECLAEKIDESIDKRTPQTISEESIHFNEKMTEIAKMLLAESYFPDIPKEGGRVVEFRAFSKLPTIEEELE